MSARRLTPADVPARTPALKREIPRTARATRAGAPLPLRLGIATGPTDAYRQGVVDALAVVRKRLLSKPSREKALWVAAEAVNDLNETFKEFR